MIGATTPGCVLAIATLVRLRDISSFSITDIKPVFTRVPCANNPSKKDSSTILLEMILKIAQLRKSYKTIAAAQQGLANFCQVEQAHTAELMED